MSDLELYIYIGLVLIYFLSRAMRKKKPQKPPIQRSVNPARDTQEKTSTEVRPLTFEELLKEFTGQKEEETPVVEAEEPGSLEEPSPGVYEYGTDDRSGENEYDDNHSETYENYDETYKSYEEVYDHQGKLITLDEQVDLSSAGRKRFEKYKIDKAENIHIARRYKNMLMNQDSIRDAIILKEILDRKYF
jgi:hypothetical protein